jgi:uncharacterized membrane protein YedE/YeeE
MDVGVPLIAQLVTFGIMPFAFCLYVLPSLLAYQRRHPRVGALVAVNLLGGLVFGIGWLLALVWCFQEPARPASS